MNLALKRLLFALGLALCMSLAIWLLMGQASPILEFANREPALGYVLMVLNFPAVLIHQAAGLAREPIDALVYLVFSQWLLIGFAASFLYKPRGSPGR